MPPATRRSIDSIPLAIRWAIAFVLVVIALIVFRPGKRKEDRAFLEETAITEAAKEAPKPPLRGPNVEYSELQPVIADALEFKMPKLGYVPKSFDEATYDQTLDQYPVLLALMQDGLVNLTPPLRRNWYRRSATDTSPPVSSQIITVTLTPKGKATLSGWQEYADRWELPLATRVLGSISPCKVDSEGRCAASFSWQYASRIPRSELIRTDSMQGRLEARKKGSRWIVERILGIHSHPLNEHDRVGGPSGLALEPGEQ